MMGFGSGNSTGNSGNVTSGTGDIMYGDGAPSHMSGYTDNLTQPIHYSDNLTRTIQNELDSFMKEPSAPINVSTMGFQPHHHKDGYVSGNATSVVNDHHIHHADVLMEGERPKRRRRRRSPPNAAIDINDNSLYNVYSFFKTFLR